MSITLIIIIITAITSFSAFANDKVYNDLIFYPPAVTHSRQWYRFFSCGLIHADYFHLIFNMYALYLFGSDVEKEFTYIFEAKGKLLYLVMYISALFFCLLPTYAKHKDDSSYRSLGASGAVSAVIFASILLAPLKPLYFMFIPIPIRGFIFGAIYLAVSSYQDRRGKDNINHSAHIWGALYGMAFLIVMAAALSQTPVVARFVEQVRSYSPF